MYCVNDLSVFATPPSATDVLCERSVSIRYPSLGYWCIVWTICQYSLPLPRLLMYYLNDLSVFVTPPSATDVLCERSVSFPYPSLGYWCIVWTICQYSLPLPRLLMYCVNDLSVFATPPSATDVLCERSVSIHYPSLGYWYCVNELSVFATPPSATDVLCERSVSIRYPSLGYWFVLCERSVSIQYPSLGYWCIVWTICQYSLPLPRLLILCERSEGIHYPSLGYWCIVWTICQYSLPLPRLLMYCVNDLSVFTTPPSATDLYCVNDLSVFVTPPSATDVLCEQSVSIRYPSLGYWCIVWTICQYSLPLSRLLMYCVNDLSVFVTPPSATDVLCERSVSIYYPSLGYWWRGNEYWQIVQIIHQ